MAKVSIYGNTIVDTVHEVNHFNDSNTSNKLLRTYESVGASGNVIRALRGFDDNLQISIHSRVSTGKAAEFAWDFFKMNNVDIAKLYYSLGSTSQAVIISDLENSERTSFVHWGVCSTMKHFEPEEDCDWAHFLYLDALENITPDHLKEFQEKGIIVSADLCKNNLTLEEKEKITSLLPYVDYLIISNIEAFAILQDEHKSTITQSREIGEKVKRWVIIHSPDGSLSSDGTTTMYQGHEEFTGPINVLGAGDHFAATFIYNMIKGETLGESISEAHIQTAKYLKKE